ncbi:hypothetical protein CHLRE_16g675550v5 [Chlamydomonas reinhardtii]|uniref:peptidylprolyl isomerase n=1 Tax=Chlamydomonas reinhardtii TaxID=3055 RepID=A8J3L4_CHLRE|nr:uncharacterized protein CHLRE_16g675550v5 [Chlamydomonas reinhardtii]PNW72258.1 hypothetical protein CHLRE_16g675550v5 [Chlamydomonas reinhardtii]|eukprot:XP_001695838.1 FKBP-type peptidyl-prolyl cis-trans isomerase [Chlamydomonas reinhardtii]
MALCMQTRFARPLARSASRVPARLLSTRVFAGKGSSAAPADKNDSGVLGRRELGLAFGAAAVFMSTSSSPASAADGLTTSKSGLQWKDVEEGTGAAPVKGSTIRCHYNGRLTNGKVFDSSYERGRPLSFQIGVGQVIKGWDMGILGAEDIPPMKEGGKRLLVIPPELGYGARGAGGVIPPNAVLEFDVELLPRK